VIYYSRKIFKDDTERSARLKTILNKMGALRHFCVCLSCRKWQDFLFFMSNSVVFEYGHNQEAGAELKSVMQERKGRQ